MNKKGFLIVSVLLLLVSFFVFQTFDRESKNNGENIMELGVVDGLKITVPVTFSADENVIALEMKVTGSIVKIECVNDSLQVIVNEKDGCVMGNFEGGVKTGVIANITFLDNPNDKPIVSGVFRNVDAKEVKNAELTIEY